MKLIGRAIGILTDNITGEKTTAFDETNHIQDKFLFESVGYWGDADFGATLFISWAYKEPGFQRRDLLKRSGNSIGGTNITGVTSPEYIWNDPVDNVHVKKIAQRFLAPETEDRTIYTIGVYYTYPDANAAVTLTTPCIQTTTQTLDVFYRVQVAFEPDYWDTDWPHDSIVPNPRELEYWAYWLIGEGKIPVDLSSQDSNWADKLNPRRLKNHLAIGYGILSLTDANLVTDTEFFSNGQKFNLPIANSIGKLIGITHFKHSSHTSLVHPQHVLKGYPNPTPVQNTFGHAADAIVPFYDAGTTQGGLGTMTLNGSAWANPDFPKQLRLNVIATGALGVGSYKFQMRNLFGFNLNTYQNMAHEVIGYHYGNKHLTDGFTIIRGNNEIVGTDSETNKLATVLKYDNHNIIAGWVDEILISDVATQEGKRFAADTTPDMSATNISQFCKDETTGDVYVACRDQGAYKISADQTTVTRMYTVTPGLTGVTGCYGINVTAGGRVWAYFGGGAGVFGLYYSDDSGANWLKPTFSHAPIDADPTLVIQVIVDPSHANDNLAVVYGDARVGDTRNLLIAWWDKAAVVAVGGTAVQGPVILQMPDYNGLFSVYQQLNIWGDFTVPVTCMKVLSCSPNDNIWFSLMRRTNVTSQVGNTGKYVFGALTITDGAANLQSVNWHNGGWGVDENGADAFFYLAATGHDNNLNWGTYVDVQVMLRGDNTFDFHEYFTESIFNVAARGFVYLGEGVYLCFHPPSWNSGLPALEGAMGGVGIISALPNPSTNNTDATGHIQDNEQNPEYGWNVDHWEKWFATAKLMHAGTEELIDGLTIAFDDAAGANNWQATDYYTTIIFNGISADASTTYEQDFEVYLKPTTLVTDFEAAVLPATSRIPGHWKETIPQSASDWQDAFNVTFGVDYIYRVAGDAYGTWDATARSLNPAISGDLSNLSGITRLNDNDLTGIQGYVEWNFYATNYLDTQRYQHAAGLSNITKVGGPLNDNTIMYGIIVDSGPDLTIDTLVTFSVIESGVVKHVTPDLDIGYKIANKVRIYIKTDGSVIYEMLDDFHGWIKLYESPPGTAVIEDLYFEYASSSYNIGVVDIKYYSHIGSDHYLFLGNGVDNGLFEPTFRAIAPDKVNITIDGLPAQNIGREDTVTTLLAGEYSIFPYHGCIRYSPADVGKTITGNFLSISDEI